MDLFTQRELRELAAGVSGPCVTINLPTDLRGLQGQQDAVRLKNLLDDAEQQLINSGMRKVDVIGMLKEPRKLALEKTFWNNRCNGLALFVAPDRFRAFRVPVPLAEYIAVTPRFILKSLLPLAMDDHPYLLLGLSQKFVRMWKGSRYLLEPLHVPALPTSMETALNYQGADRGEQVHSGARIGQGKQAAVFHGQGGVSDTAKSDLSNFFREVNGAIANTLQREHLPLVVATVDYLFPLFRETCDYPGLLESHIHGNPERIVESELREQAWECVAPEMSRSRGMALAKYRRLCGTGQTSDNVLEILPAAFQGRIETLFVNPAIHQWGRFDSQAQSVVEHSRFEFGDDELVNLAAMHTFENSGEVVPRAAAEMPSEHPLAAIYRY